MDVVDCNMPCVCEMSLWVFILIFVMTCYMDLWVLLKFQMSNSWRNSLRSFMRIWASSLVKRMIWLLNSTNPIKWLRNIRNLLKKIREFECLKVDLDAKLVLSNKLVDHLKCENESPKMYARCLIVDPSYCKNEENICCNHVVRPDFVPIHSTSKEKSVYIPPPKRNQKWR